MTLLLAVTTFGILLCANICASLIPATRRIIRKYDLLKLVGQWTFFSNSPHTLFTDVEVVVTSATNGENVTLRLSEMTFPHFYPFFDPYRRYWRIIYEHTLFAKTEVVAGPHTLALHEVARSIAEAQTHVDSIEIRILPVTELGIQRGQP